MYVALPMAASTHAYVISADGTHHIVSRGSGRGTNQIRSDPDVGYSRDSGHLVAPTLGYEMLAIRHNNERNSPVM